MRIAYFGSGAFGIPTLSALAAEHQVVCVVTQPDRPAGRGGAMTPTPVAAWCAEQGAVFPTIKPPDVNAPDVRDRLRSMSAQAWVVIAFGQKLGPDLLRGTFAVNLHASLLPRWRGAAPIHSAVLSGDEQTGNTVITLADRMDAGEILGQTARTIGDDTTTGELHDLLAGDGAPLMLDVLARHSTGSLSPTAQDESRVTKARKLSRSDAWVDFGRPARECLRRVHGLTPWPGVTLTLHGAGKDAAEGEFKVLRVEIAGPDSGQTSTAHEAPLHPPPSEAWRTPGRLIGEPLNGRIACGGETSLRLVEVQPPGKRPMRWIEYARGARLSGALTARSTVPPPLGDQTC